ncbi:GntR family transcriptional regulator [Streptomyces sp. NPDC051018]|uniref:GntR family transcriptional regulator n=1 Tax=Streptomyces sp. NPDC051018 TaxID=3365639 RepID=UPI00379D3D93
MTQVIANWLREAVYTGELKPGDRVGQQAVGERFGVSRIPVREALRLLESEGLVDIRPNSGARVAALNFAEYTEIYMIRERLEPLALSQSIAHLTPGQLERIAPLRDEVEASVGDPGAWLEADRRFHLACYAGVPTERLLRLIQDFWNTTQRYRRVLLSTFTEGEYAIAHHEHRLIADAVLTGNARAGEELIRTHIERSRLRLSDHRELFDD